jgi:hypothetical protein
MATDKRDASSDEQNIGPRATKDAGVNDSDSESTPDSSSTRADAGTDHSLQDAGQPTDAIDASASSEAFDGGAPSLPGTPCSLSCAAGEWRCDLGQVQHCEDAADGCAAWVVSADCVGQGSSCQQDDDTAQCQPIEETCTDRSQNQGEEGVDCGGPCAACPAATDCASDPLNPACTADACAANPNPYIAPNTLTWPLVSQSDGLPRQALGNTFGELQTYPPSPPNIHTGIDIRGLEGDHVSIVTDGNLFRPANLAECEEGAGTICRVYLMPTSGRYVYYYSHLRFFESDPISAELRAKFTNAVSQDYEIKPGTEVAKGDKLSDIADFYDNQWAHLHFAVFDTEAGYDGINPLHVLDLETANTFDDERPAIAWLGLSPDDSWNSPLALDTPSGELQSQASIEGLDCDKTTSGKVDVLVQAKDRFFTQDPAPATVPGAIDSVGIYEANYVVRNLAAAKARSGTWYRFDQAPFDCAGPARGASCPAPLTLDAFHASTVDYSDGAPMMALSYSPVLWDVSNSQSLYYDVEYYVQVLTNSWGEPGSWDTSLEPDGLYQVSARVADAAGNASSFSLFTRVSNGTAVEAAGGEAALRDRFDDPGAEPSDMAAEGSASSPDIIVVAAGTAVDVEANVDALDPTLTGPLQADTSYDVYVRVSNLDCAPLSNVKVRLSSLPAGLLQPKTQLVAISDGFVSDAAHPEGLGLDPRTRALLGPFTWKPTKAELGTPRALLAELDAPVDSNVRAETWDDTSSGLMRYVAHNNNVGLRNLLSRVNAPDGFELELPTLDGTCAELRIDVPDSWSLSQGDSVTLSLPASSELAASWEKVPGTSHSTAGDAEVVSVKRHALRLPLASSGDPISLSWSGPSGNGARVGLYIDGNLAGEVELR